MQSIPLAVLKLNYGNVVANGEELHAIHTACGIETIHLENFIESAIIACNPYRLRY